MDTYLNANIVFSKFCNEYAEIKKDLPIRPSEMGVLNIIVKRDGLFTPIMIAELLEVSKPMITAHINILEKKGYIIRECSKEDKRSFYVLPTEKARDLVKIATKKMNKILSTIENSIGEDGLDTLIETLEKVNQCLKEKK